MTSISTGSVRTNRSSVTESSFRSKCCRAAAFSKQEMTSPARTNLHNKLGCSHLLTGWTQYNTTTTTTASTITANNYANIIPVVGRAGQGRTDRGRWAGSGLAWSRGNFSR